MGCARPGAVYCSPLDPALRRTIRNADLHASDYSPWEGHDVSVWPSMTILRGKIAMENGQLYATPTDGQWQTRRMTDDILAPAL